MKSMFTVADYSEMITRIENLKPDTTRQWGKMDVSQMLAHCSGAMKMALGDLNLKRPFISYLIGGMIKKKFLSETPFSKNSPTSPAIVIADQREFEKERQALLVLVKRFHEGGEAGATKHPHSFFGPLTPAQWGEIQYKHLDHHLRQFGA